MAAGATRGARRSRANVLALARWEDNRDGWLRGGFYGLDSKLPTLQGLVGDGGTLWIVVSRRRSRGGRLYSLSFRLTNCKARTYAHEGAFGRYGVVGDPVGSALFASNDAKLLLLSLRFQPYRPITTADKIGQSLQTPRRLGAADVALLREHATAVDRWGVFLSYARPDLPRARRLADALHRLGVNVFRDQEALRGGDYWWPAIKRAIRGSRHVLLLWGRHTHTSHWVQRELRYAHRRGTHVLPILAGGAPRAWPDLPWLHRLHAIPYGDPTWSDFTRDLVALLRT